LDFEFVSNFGFRYSNLIEQVFLFRHYITIGAGVKKGWIGVTAVQIMGGQLWLAASVAVSLAIVVMHLTKTLHPPGGATALIAVIGGDSVHNLGYWYVLMPTAMGAVIMLIIALIVNNISRNRRYPEFWF